MTRSFVNVAFAERYWPYQVRLVESLERVGWQGGIVKWRGEYPPQSPTHHAVHYAFKLFALEYALKLGHRTLLWVDSRVYATAPVEPLFDQLERDGYFLVHGADMLGNWTSDDCLAHWSMNRDEAMGVWLLSGTYIGFDLGNSLGREIFREWQWHYEQGRFMGARSKDPRCLGHRNDEVPLSFMAHKMGLKPTSITDVHQWLNSENDLCSSPSTSTA